MPVILRQGNAVVRIYAPPREHPPPHVHIEFRGIGEVVVLIGSPEGGPHIHRDYGLSARLIVVAYNLVADHQERFQHAWEELHGIPPSD